MNSGEFAAAPPTAVCPLPQPKPELRTDITRKAAGGSHDAGFDFPTSWVLRSSWVGRAGRAPGITFGISEMMTALRPVVSRDYVAALRRNFLMVGTTSFECA